MTLSNGSKSTNCSLFPVFAVALLLSLAGCGGGGGGGGGDNAPAPGNNPNPPQAALTAQSLPQLPANNSAIHACPTTSTYSLATPPAPAAGKIIGRVTFDRVPFFTQLGRGLDYASQSALPARGVVVEAVAPSATGQCNGPVVATALTDGDGWYELTPGTGAVCVRARAQVYRAADTASAAHWNIGVADNTNADTLFLLEDSSAASAAARARRDLHAASGWSNGVYNGVRAAAPFAILDTACKAMNAVIAARPAAQFGALTYFWSTKNTSDSSGTVAQGKVGGAFFSSSAVAIYLRGDAAVDTDEFDEMVIAHEFGHFVTYTFSRADSIGGEHSLTDYEDPRVAFDEGWATAFAGLVLHTAIYRDSNQLTSSASGFAQEFHFNLQSTYGNVPIGWYSEMSVQRALFNIGADASFNGLGIGVEGLLQSFAGPYKTSPALATIFSYVSQLKSDQLTMANDIAHILNTEAMNGDAVQPFAETETNAANVNDLPVYQLIAADAGPQLVCSSAEYETTNMLSNRRYLRFDVSVAGNYRFSVQPQSGYAQAVAGFELLKRGSRLTSVVGTEDSVPNRSVHYATVAPLTSDTYVLSVFHVGNAVKDSTVAPGLQCFNVSVATL